MLLDTFRPDMWDTSNISHMLNRGYSPFMLTSMNFSSPPVEVSLEAYCYNPVKSIASMLSNIPNPMWSDVQKISYNVECLGLSPALIDHIYANRSTLMTNSYISKLESNDKYFALYAPIPAMENICGAEWGSVETYSISMHGHQFMQPGLRSNPKISGYVYFRHNLLPDNKIALKQRAKAWRTCIFR